MKCKQCNGNYKTRELKCPYCGTQNLLGKIWQSEREEMEEKYRQTKEDNRKAIPYVINRILRRIFVVEVSLVILFVIGVFLFFGIQDIVKKLDYKINHASIISKLDTALEQEDFQTLESLNDRYRDYAGDELYCYIQAEIMNRNLDEMKQSWIDFLELSPEKQTADSYYLERVIRDAGDVLSMDCGIYSELERRNEDLYQRYSMEARAFLTGTLGFDGDEIALLTENKYLLSDEMTRLTGVALERGTWQ